MDFPVKAFELEWKTRRSSVPRAKATLIEVGDREYRLLKGALCVKRDAPALPESGRRRRAEARNEGVLVDTHLHPEYLELTEDRVFTSISGAAAFVLGMSAQGSAWWTPVSELGASSRETPPEEAMLIEQRLIAEMERFLTARAGYERVMEEFLDLVRDMLHSDDWNPPCSITSRIKEPGSLMKKLTKEKAGASGRVRKLEEVTDIVGVRVIFYSRADLAEFNRRLEVLRALLGNETSPAVPEGGEGPDDPRRVWAEGIRSLLPTDSRAFRFLSDDVRHDRTEGPTSGSELKQSYYVARHWGWEFAEVLHLKTHNVTLDVTPMPYACELQVVYILDHVVNEVLHDLIYKEDSSRRDEDLVLRDRLDFLASNLRMTEAILQEKIIDYLRVEAPSGSELGAT